jgi:hypothetical protein
VASYRSVGIVWVLESESESESESYFTTDSQPASLFWNTAPFWDLRPDPYYCLTVAGLLIWGALSDESTGLSFTLLLVLASAVIFGSESRRTRGHILLSDFETALSVASYDSQGHGGGIRPRLHAGLLGSWN